VAIGVLEALKIVITSKHCSRRRAHNLLKVEIEKLGCVLSKRATRPYIWSYKCECVRTHLCIDPTEYHQPISQPSPSLSLEPSSPAIQRRRSIYATPRYLHTCPTLEEDGGLGNTGCSPDYWESWFEELEIYTGGHMKRRIVGVHFARVTCATSSTIMNQMLSASMVSGRRGHSIYRCSTVSPMGAGNTACVLTYRNHDFGAQTPEQVKRFTLKWCSHPKQNQFRDGSLGVRQHN